eukprot:s1802_g9.t1
MAVGYDDFDDKPVDRGRPLFSTGHPSGFALNGAMASPPPRRRRLSISWADKVAAINPQPWPISAAPVAPMARLRRKTPSQAHFSGAGRFSSQTEVDNPPVVGLPVRTQDLHNLKATIQAPKVALASCTKGCPAERLREWLFWHLAKGIQLVLFRWEGPLGPEHQAILEDSRMKHRVILLEHSLEGKASGSFQRVMTRQIRFVHRAIKFARERGFDFLLHLDDDEILYPEGQISIPELFEKHVKTSKRCVHFENLEAIFQFQLQHGRPFSRASTRFRDLKISFTSSVHCHAAKEENGCGSHPEHGKAKGKAKAKGEAKAKAKSAKAAPKAKAATESLSFSSATSLKATAIVDIETKIQTTGRCLLKAQLIG